MRVLTVIGTRPEAIKMAPVILELQKCSEIESILCVTAQHREMLDQMLGLFELRPQIDLNLMETDQDLASLTARAVSSLSAAFNRVRPDLVMVQGDTTTAMAAGLSSFYQRVAVGHVEAGLRTESRYSPFPEEINRRLLGVLASYHFAPTQRAARALLREGIAQDRIYVTGNPIIDALHFILRRSLSKETVQLLSSLGLSSQREGSAQGPRTLVVTAHRRENFGEPLNQICKALQTLVDRNQDVQIVYPVHRNPHVQRTVFGRLAGIPRIHLLDSLPYESFVHLLARCHLILTDSGGLQEEGPALGRPVLVLRETSERPEGIEAGNARIVGTESSEIVRQTECLLLSSDEYRSMSQTVSPYGDGAAAKRIVQIILDQRDNISVDKSAERF